MEILIFIAVTNVILIIVLCNFDISLSKKVEKLGRKLKDRGKNNVE